MTNNDKARKMALGAIAAWKAMHLECKPGQSNTVEGFMDLLHRDEAQLATAITNALLRFAQEQESDCPCAHATKPCNHNCPCGSPVMSGVCVMCVRGAAPDNKREAADDIMEQESEAVRELELGKEEQVWTAEIASEQISGNIVKEQYARGVVSGIRIAAALIAKHSRKGVV